VELFGDERERGDGGGDGHRGRAPGCARGELAVLREQVGRRLGVEDGVGDLRDRDLGAELEAAELELGDDTEVGAPAAHAPEQVGVLVGAGGQGVAVDGDPGEIREVDHETVVDDGAAGDVVAAAADGDPEVRLAGEPDRRGDVVCRGDADDDPGEPVDAAVPEGAGVVVALVLWGDHVAGDGGAEVGDELLVEGSRDDFHDELGKCPRYYRRHTA